MEIVIGIIIGVAAGILGTALIGYKWVKGQLNSHASEQAELLESAKAESATIRREAEVAAREEGVKLPS